MAIEKETKSVEIGDAEESLIEKPIELNEENIKKVREEIAEEVRKDAGISDEQSEEFKRMLDEATMPVEYLDKDFKLGDQELDIRKLNTKNYKQMVFRTLVLHSVYLKNVQSCLIDIERLLMVLLDHLGVENIIKATDNIIAKTQEQNEELKKFVDRINPNNKA